MNKKEFSKWMRGRRLGRRALYVELVYAVILLLTLIFNFPLFMHLLLFQFIFIVLFFLGGWIYDAYAGSHGQALVKVKKRDTLWETITSIRLNRKFFYRLFSVVVILVAIGVMAVMLRPIFAYLLQAPNPKVSEALTNFNLYCNLAYLILQLLILSGLLLGKKKVVRINGVIVIILSLILIFTQPAYRAAEIVGLLVGLAGILLCLRDQI